MPPAGIARSASSSAASGAVTNVGWKAVVPVASSASPTRTYPSWSVAIRSTPANPLTCRSTNPGAAMSLPVAAGQADGLDHAVGDRDVARDQHAVDQRRRDAQPHSSCESSPYPFTAPAVRAVIRCLRASTNTSATGSV